jgi:hypothetical protein
MKLIPILWVLGIILEVALYLFLARHSAKKYPAFTVYIGILASSDTLLLFVQNYVSDEAYFWGWWAQYTISALALIAVVVEIFIRQFYPLWIIPVGPRAAFIFITFVIGLGLVCCAFYFPADHLDSYLRILRTFGRTVDVFAACLMWLVVLLASYFKMPWNLRSYGIAVGLCVKLTSGSALAILRASENHRAVQDLLVPIGMLLALCAEAIWLYFFARYKQPEKESPEIIERAHVVTRLYRNSMRHVLASLKQ